MVIITEFHYYRILFSPREYTGGLISLGRQFNCRPNI